MSAIIILPEASAFGRAAAKLGRAAGGNRALINAVNKAHLFLAKGTAGITHTGFDGWLVSSATRAIVQRVNSFGQCSCESGTAGRPCWHAQSIAILEQAGLYRRDTMESAPLGKPMGERLAAARAARYSEALSAVNELF
jgi:hypothetical protein